MTTSSPKSTRKRGRYHHGNLRAALVDAARGIVEDQGTRALTLREVARRVGVTHAAPYRHFKDKGALLAALAENSYARVLEEMGEEIGAGGDARLEVAKAAEAYMRFAIAHPASYEIMFDGETGRALPPAAAALRILEALDAALAPLPLSADQRRDAAAAIWSACHGMALLVNGGRLHLTDPGRHARDTVLLLVAAPKTEGDPDENRDAVKRDQ